MGNIEEQFGRQKAGDNRIAFAVIFLLMVFSLGTLAFILDGMDIPKKVRKKIVKVQASFEIAQVKRKPKPVVKKKIEKKKKVEKKKKKKVEKKKKPEKKKVVDLTKKPKMNAKKDVIVKKPTKKTRKVYGVNRVYSQNLGSGGSREDAVITKVGNDARKAPDTLTATKEDLKGEVVSQVTVTKAPSFKKRVKPKISDEMRKNNVEGVIKVKVLVDIDGKVKKALAKNSLGFGSKMAAIQACMAMEFFPAKRGKEPVAVWITIPIRFSKIS